MPAGGATNSDVGFGEQEVQLPEPIVAVDGTLVHQLLIMHRFEVDQEEAAFVFQLHPTETTTCPQYLVVARCVTSFTPLTRSILKLMLQGACVYDS